MRDVIQRLGFAFRAFSRPIGALLGMTMSVVMSVMVSIMPADAASARYEDLSDQLVEQAQIAIDKNGGLSKAIARGQADATLSSDMIAPIRELLTQALVANPQNAQAYYVMAALALVESDHLEASRYGGTVLQIDPTLRDAYVVKGRADLARGERGAAQDSLNQLVSLCGSCPQSEVLTGLMTAYAAAHPDDADAPAHVKKDAGTASQED